MSFQFLKAALLRRCTPCGDEETSEELGSFLRNIHSWGTLVYQFVLHRICLTRSCTPVMTVFTSYIVPIPESSSCWDAAHHVEMKRHLRSLVCLAWLINFGEIFVCRFIYFYRKQHLHFGFVAGAVKTLLYYLGATYELFCTEWYFEARVWIHSVRSSAETSDFEKFGDIVPFLFNPLLFIYLLLMRLSFISFISPFEKPSSSLLQMNKDCDKPRKICTSYVLPVFYRRPGRDARYTGSLAQRHVWIWKPYA